MTGLEVIARTYDMLSQCRYEDIESAAQTPGLLPELRRSLEHLARARERLSEGAAKHPKPKPSTRGGPYRDPVAAFVRTMNDTQRFPSNELLAVFLNKLGLDLSFNKKDGRNRMSNKFVRSLRRASAEYQEKVLRRLAASDSETASWFEVIRGDHN